MILKYRDWVPFCCCWSVAKLFLDFLWPHGLQHARLPVLRYLPEFAQIHIHWVDDANHFILCHSLILLPSTFPSIRIPLPVVTSSVQFSHSVVSDSLQPHGQQHARPPCPSPTPRAYSNSCPLHQWCHPAISSSVVPFSSCLQSFPASGSFPVSWFFTSGGQSIGVSASASVLTMNIQDWYPLGWTDLISLQSKDSQESSKTQFKTISSSALSFLYSPTLTSIHDYWKNHSFD